MHSPLSTSKSRQKPNVFAKSFNHPREASRSLCGSWSRGLTLHEDAIVTALEAVNRLVGPGRSAEF